MFMLYREKCLLDITYIGNIFENIVGFYPTKELANQKRLSYFDMHIYRIQEVEYIKEPECL